MFLEKDVILQEDAIENIFCTEFQKVRKHKMDEETSKMFLQLMMSSDENPELEKELKTMFPYQLMIKRLEGMYSYDLDLRTKFFLIYLTDGLPGMLVMYLTYLQFIAKKHNVSKIDFKFFGMHAFPIGFPSKEDLKTLWEKQKVKASPDNLLDHMNALKSIL